jgi:cholesterol transport system auxiliary component
MRRSGWWRAAALAVVGLALQGCAVLSGGGPPPDLYHLTAPTRFSADLPNVGFQLLVDIPTAPAGIDTSLIAVGQRGGKITYFAGSNWVDRAPVMLQSLIVEALENSRRIMAVGRDAVGLRADYVLMTELRAFEADYGGAPPKSSAARIQVRMSAKLVRMPGRSIVAAESFEADALATGSGFGEVVAAFDEATGDILTRLAEWALRAGQQATGT